MPRQRKQNSRQRKLITSSRSRGAEYLTRHFFGCSGAMRSCRLTLKANTLGAENCPTRHKRAIFRRVTPAAAIARCESRSEPVGSRRAQTSRRLLLVSALSTPVFFSTLASAANAAEEGVAWRELELFVTLAPGAEAPGGEAGALYITVRPPGRSPVVAVKRVPYPISFPLRTTARVFSGRPRSTPCCSILPLTATNIADVRGSKVFKTFLLLTR